MENGMMQCCRKFSEDTTGKDPCCSVSIHNALVNWLGTGVSSSSLLSSCVDHTHTYNMEESAYMFYQLNCIFSDFSSNTTSLENFKKIKK
jgi:hypothetical protein